MEIMNKVKYRDIIKESMIPSVETDDFIFSLQEEDDFRDTTSRLLDNLYVDIKKKYSGIDLGEISRSRGDISKCRFYKTLMDTLKAIRALQSQSGIKDEPYDYKTVSEAIMNVERKRNYFVNGYVKNREDIKYLYETTVYCIVATVTYMVSDVMLYLRDNTSSDYMSVMKGNQGKIGSSMLVIDTLNHFNKLAVNGTLDKFFKADESNLHEGLGDIIKYIGIAGGAGIAIVPVFMLVKSLIYFIFNFRMKISKMLEEQAEFLSIHTDIISDNNYPTLRDRKKVIEQQREKVEKLKELSQKIAVNFDDAQVDTKKALEASKVSSRDLSLNFDIPNGMI